MRRRVKYDEYLHTNMVFKYFWVSKRVVPYCKIGMNHRHSNRQTFYRKGMEWASLHNEEGTKHVAKLISNKWSFRNDNTQDRQRYFILKIFLILKKAYVIMLSRILSKSFYQRFYRVIKRNHTFKIFIDIIYLAYSSSAFEFYLLARLW